MNTLGKFENVLLLKDRAYEAIKREIILGHFHPGDKLNISELSSMMNISYAPIREALNLLCKEGLVDLPPHKQAVVTAGSKADFEITVKLRLMIEPFAAELSANVVPRCRLEEMRRTLLAVLDNPKDEDAYMESDLQLHEMLHMYAGSKTLSDILESLKTYNIRYRYLTENADAERREDMICTITKEHLGIIDAFESGDAAEIRDRVAKHIESYYKRCIESEKQVHTKVVI